MGPSTQSGVSPQKWGLAGSEADDDLNTLRLQLIRMDNAERAGVGRGAFAGELRGG